MTALRGIDVSQWQPKTPDLSGLAFAFARATYGTGTDPVYATHAANFRKAGIVVGAYAFGVNGRRRHAGRGIPSRCERRGPAGA